jgi:hypothetical protein
MNSVVLGLAVLACLPLLATGQIATYSIYVDHFSTAGAGSGLYGLEIKGTGTLANGVEQAGQFLVTGPNGLPDNAPPAYEGPSFTGYCMELGLAIGGGENVAADVLNFAEYSNPAEPYNWIMPEGWQKASYLYNTYNPLVDSHVEAAALQAAIWTSLYGGEKFRMDEANDGAYTYQSQVRAQWDIYVADANKNGSSHYFNSSFWQGYTLDDYPVYLDQQQGLIGPPQIPEPMETGIAAVLVLGCIAGWEIRRRRIRARPASSVRT